MTYYRMSRRSSREATFHFDVLTMRVVFFGASASFHVQLDGIMKKPSRLRID